MTIYIYIYTNKLCELDHLCVCVYIYTQINLYINKYTYMLWYHPYFDTQWTLPIDIYHLPVIHSERVVVKATQLTLYDLFL